ncbi:tetracycline resistance transcriptional repressor TetR [Brevundimonas diminuta]|uniref:tetracycline resistance transcriptional repressor TetR n=1 Tax=Brevundimonas diminuta TaxID=293 RepID=UPI003207F022
MTKLDRHMVIEAALELLDEVGMDGLSTRKLADRLKVQQPALYWHFPSKRALLDALSEAILLQRHDRSMPYPDEDWRSFLKANAHSFRKALLAYRDGARLHAGTRPRGAHSEAAEAQIRMLSSAGFSPGRAVWALAAISHYVVGSALEQQSTQNGPATPPAIPAYPVSDLLQTAIQDLEGQDPALAFDFGLECLICGLAAKV